MENDSLDHLKNIARSPKKNEQELQRNGALAGIPIAASGWTQLVRGEANDSIWNLHIVN